MRHALVLCLSAALLSSLNCVHRSKDAINTGLGPGILNHQGLKATTIMLEGNQWQAFEFQSICRGDFKPSIALIDASVDLPAHTTVYFAITELKSEASCKAAVSLAQLGRSSVTCLSNLHSVNYLVFDDTGWQLPPSATMYRPGILSTYSTDEIPGWLGGTIPIMTYQENGIRLEQVKYTFVSSLCGKNGTFKASRNRSYRLTIYADDTAIGGSITLEVGLEGAGS